MKIVDVVCSWESFHEIEVPDDWEDTGSLSNFPARALDEMTPSDAALLDWRVVG